MLANGVQSKFDTYTFLPTSRGYHVFKATYNMSYIEDKLVVKEANMDCSYQPTIHSRVDTEIKRDFYK